MPVRCLPGLDRLSGPVFGNLRTPFTFPADCREEKRPSGGGEYGKIQGRLDAECHRHGERERQEKHAARKRDPPRLPSYEESHGNEDLAHGRRPGESGDGRFWSKPIQLRDVRNKRLPVPPSDV